MYLTGMFEGFACKLFLKICPELRFSWSAPESRNTWLVEVGDTRLEDGMVMEVMIGG